MPVERGRHPPVVTCLPRSSVQVHLHKDVDILLKELKSCVRRLLTAMGSYTNEMRVLERLYYKNKNQHRTSLFFKRVSEIRRYGNRLVELKLPERIELLRASFFGFSTPRDIDPKVFKGAWDHVPDGFYLSFVMERLLSSRKLVGKMIERLAHSYHHFSVAMQSGAFIQLIVLFSAISSRMSTLLSELGQVLDHGALICDRFLSIFKPEHRPMRSYSLALQGRHTTYETSRPSTICITSAEDVLESFGVTENHLPGLNSRSSPTGYDTLPMLDIPACDPLPRPEAMDKTIAPPQTSERVEDSEFTVIQERHRPKKIKKKRRNEIDEIFGF